MPLPDSSQVAVHGYAVRSNHHIPLCQRFSCEQFISLQILLNGLIHNFRRQCPVMTLIGLQPVPGKLFVEGGLAMARLIPFCRPEPGTVRCQHLVPQHNVARFIQAKFELGVRNDNATAKGILRTLW